jgi:hypothetical protein
MLKKIFRNIKTFLSLMRLFPPYEMKSHQGMYGSSQESICNDVNKVIMRIEKKQCTKKFIR